jgi:hypothetical protein
VLQHERDALPPVDPDVPAADAAEDTDLIAGPNEEVADIRRKVREVVREILVASGPVDEDAAPSSASTRQTRFVGKHRRRSASVSSTIPGYFTSKEMRRRCVRGSFAMCPSPRYSPSNSA